MTALKMQEEDAIMAKTVDLGVTDTPISGVSSLTFDRGLLNFKEDFRIKSNQNGKEVMLSNITSPIDRGESIRLAYNDINNIYSGTSIDPSVYSPTKRGISVLTQITNTLSVRDSSDPNFRVDLPISAHLVVKVPSSEFINAQQVEVLIGRLLSSLFDTGSTSESRLEAILRGSLLPTEL